MKWDRSFHVFSKSNAMKIHKLCTRGRSIFPSAYKFDESLVLDRRYKLWDETDENTIILKI